MALLITQHGGTVFVKYDNIYMVKLPCINTNNKWTVSIIFNVVCNNKSGFDFHFKTEDDAKKRYIEIVEKCTSHYERERCLEEKLNKLFSLIEVLPGGEEYEKAKSNFQNETDK